jgi:magnesium transporter
MMTLDFVAVRPEWTVRDVARLHPRARLRPRDAQHDLVVDDEAAHLIDDVRVRRFLLSPLGPAR